MIKLFSNLMNILPIDSLDSDSIKIITMISQSIENNHDHSPQSLSIALHAISIYKQKIKQGKAKNVDPDTKKLWQDLQQEYLSKLSNLEKTFRIIRFIT